MLLVTFCLLELRSVLHPEVLADIIRLPDPEEQMMKNLLQEHVQKIVARMLISTVVYVHTSRVLFVYRRDVRWLSSRCCLAPTRRCFARKQDPAQSWRREPRAQGP